MKGVDHLAVLRDYVERSTHWREGGATRHDAMLAVKALTAPPIYAQCDGRHNIGNPCEDPDCYSAPAQRRLQELIDAANDAANVLAEVYAKHQLRIGPFASQAQRANVRLQAAVKALKP